MGREWFPCARNSSEKGLGLAGDAVERRHLVDEGSEEDTTEMLGKELS